MLGVVFIDSFAESWRCTQAQPITAFCPCCLASTGTGCMRRPRARRRRSRRSRTVRGRSSEPSSDPDPSSPRSHPRRFLNNRRRA